MSFEMATRLKNARENKRAKSVFGVLGGARMFLAEIETGHQDDHDYDSAAACSFSILLFWGRNAEFLEYTALDHCQNDIRDTFFLRRITGIKYTFLQNAFNPLPYDFSFQSQRVSITY